MNTVITSVRNGVRLIKFNKLEKKNAVTIPEFEAVRKFLQDDASSNDSTLTVITGNGDFFTSGLDIKQTFKEINENCDVFVPNFVKSIKGLVEEIVNYPKLLVAVVNGPAVGIGVTILGLCDYVYASERATFQTPFVKLGINAEVCSSLTFPKIMGRSRATDLIFLGNKIDADAAKEIGLVGQLYKDGKNEEIYSKIEEMAKLPSSTMKINKKLIMDNVREELLACNRRECEMLEVTLKSPEFFNALNTFLTAKSKKL